MSKSPENKSRPLIGPLALIAMVVLVVVVLVSLYLEQGQSPDKNNLKDYQNAPLTYLKQLLASHPNNDALRLEVARDLVRQGKYDQIPKLLLGLTKPDSLEIKKFHLYMNWQRFTAALPGNPQREIYKKQVLQSLENLQLEPDKNLDSKTLNNMATYYLAVNHSQQAALLYQRLAKKNKKNTKYLKLGAQAALAAGDLNLAMSFTDQLIQINPNNAKWQQQMGTIALQANNLPKAATAYQYLAQLHPDDINLQEKLAQIYVWNHQGDKALPLYARLAKEHPSAAFDQKIISVARSLYDHNMLAAALMRENARQRLAPAQMKLLITNLDDFLGKPDRAAQVLKSWLSSASKDYPLWLRLAEIYARTNRPKLAIKTLKRIIKIYGPTPHIIQALAGLYINLWDFHKALETLATLNRPAHDKNLPLSYWQLFGDLSWETRKMNGVITGYQRLFKLQHGKLNSSGVRRLTTAYFKTGQLQKAMLLVKNSWDHLHDPSLLLSTVVHLNNLNHHRFAEPLMNLAKANINIFDKNVLYWLLRGNSAVHLKKYKKAKTYYWRALQLNPDNSDAKSAFLWLLINQKHNRQLRHYLNLWRSSTLNNPQLQEAYAAGYWQTGQLRQALQWFARLAKEQPDNYLLLLRYADALDSLHFFDSAYRLRLYALTQLRPKILKQTQLQSLLSPSQRQLALTVITEQMDLLGGGQNLAWIKRVLFSKSPGQLSQKDLELLITWRLYQNQKNYARLWLLRARLRRLNMPYWQQLSIALASNNLSQINHILTSSTQMGVGDRVNGYEKTGQKAKALRLALNHINKKQKWVAGIGSLPGQAAALYQQMPQNAGANINISWLSGLQLSTARASGILSNQNWSLFLKARATKLNEHDLNLNINGLDFEKGAAIALTHRGRRSATTAGFGYVHSTDASFLTAQLQSNYKLTDQLSANIFGHYNQQTLDSQYFRVLGLRDSLGVGIDYRLTARDHINLQASGLQYKSRWEEYFGNGYQVQATFSRSILLGQTYQASAYINASYMHNNLSSTLPWRMAARLPPGSTASLLLPDEYGYSGVGITFTHGPPAGNYPQAGGLRYKADFAIGYVWPDNQVAVSLNGSIGTRVLGSDELSLFFGLDQTQSKTGGSNISVGLSYKYFFGK